MSESRTVIDQMGREVRVPVLPQRIISLVPSQTELLYDLGLGDRVVGITKFCVHPAFWLKEKIIVGGTKKFRFEAIEQLQPDLIIGNKEENYKEGIEQLEEQYPVWMSDIADLSQALHMIREVATICGCDRQGRAMADDIESGLRSKGKEELGSTVYLIWKKPFMAAGKGTFIDELLPLAGFENLVKEERYPELVEAQLQSLNPDHVLLSSEPYPFSEKHVREIQEILPNTRVTCVDGEMFSWYGSRLLKLPAYLSQLGEKIKK